MNRPLRSLLGSCLLVAGCTPTAADAPALAPMPRQEAALALPAEGAGTELTVRAASCWLGGFWGDIGGEGTAERARDAHRRCTEVIEQVYQAVETTKLEQLRALDTHALVPLRRHIRDVALADPVDRGRVEHVMAFFDDAAMAARESLDARRAAHRILHDLSDEPGMLAGDELPAVAAFARVTALDALLHARPSTLRADERVLGLLVALDRSGESRALPPGLKPYLCAPVYASVFGTPAPDLTPAPSPPPAPGVWLQYLQSAAATAGHRAPLLVSRQRQALEAEAGILAGFADELQASAGQLDEASTLRGIAEDTASRLREESRRVRQD